MFCVIVVYAWGLGPRWKAPYGALAAGYLVVVGLARSGVPLLAGSWAQQADGLDLVALSLGYEGALGLALWLARRQAQARRRALEQALAEVERASRLAEPFPPARADLPEQKAGARSGQIVGGFRLGALLGRGGMGEVFRAEHVVDGFPVAVKLLQRPLAEQAGPVRRFFREIRAQREIDSPHVVKLLDWGWSNDGCPFLAMELLRGTDLASVLHHCGSFDLGETVWMTDQVAAALDAMHEAGVIHRDLKPHNIFLAEEADGKRWKVLDFGVSKLVEAATSGADQSVVGTPSYMSPEQALGEPIDRRSDVFALAAVIYRALTGRPAFSAPHPIEVLDNIVQRQPPRPSDYARVPDDVDLVLAIGLAKDIADRFATAGELATALRAAVRGRLGAALRRKAGALLAAAPWRARESIQAAPPSGRPLSWDEPSGEGAETPTAVDGPTDR